MHGRRLRLAQPQWSFCGGALPCGNPSHTTPTLVGRREEKVFASELVALLADN